MINRDEGCNKVDCLLCGYRFCWRCGSGWSQVYIYIFILECVCVVTHSLFYQQTCGFYQCGEDAPAVATATTASPESDNSSVKGEGEEKDGKVRRNHNLCTQF